MIQGYCRTNLDEYKKEEWPEEFVAVPRIGEWVAAKNNRRLKVVGITHLMLTPEPGRMGTCPGIEVELNR